MPFHWSDFKEIYVVDFEFLANPGEIQVPICYVAKEVYSGKVIKKWLSGEETQPDYPLDSSTLFVAFFASAEMGCHAALSWDRPRNILDLYAEFRNQTNGKSLPAGRGLIGACLYYGINDGDATYKDVMRERILEGFPYNQEEQAQILDYCEKDVDLTIKLFHSMKNSIALQQGLLRGRYMWSVAQMEFYGIPLNQEILSLLRQRWDTIKEKLVAKVDIHYGVFEGTKFKTQKFVEYLTNQGIPWEFTATGLPRLDENFFKDQAKAYPKLKPLQELRHALGQLRLNDLSVGIDGRNRTLLSPYGTITSRHAPSSSKYIFGNAVWLRNLIQPTEGMALAYIDYEQQEIGVAAALSGDEKLLAAYNDGDPYLAFAKEAGAVPPNATKASHSDVREQFKTCMLGINYGMGAESFSRRANIPLAFSKYIYKKHRAAYRRYWEWIEAYIDEGQLLGCVSTRFGWNYYTKERNYRTLQNFPMQGSGADILRVAITLCLENGVRVIAPVHDAILIEAPAGSIENAVAKAQWLMERAALHVIGMPLRTEAKIFRYPEHYTDKRGDVMWGAVMELLLAPN